MLTQRMCQPIATANSRAGWCSTAGAPWWSRRARTRCGWCRCGPGTRSRSARRHRRGTSRWTARWSRGTRSGWRSAATAPRSNSDAWTTTTAWSSGEPEMIDRLRVPFFVVALLAVLLVVLLETSASLLIGGRDATAGLLTAAGDLEMEVTGGGGGGGGVSEPPGRAISYLALVDGVLLFTLLLM